MSRPEGRGTAAGDPVDAALMRRALALAERGRGTVSPNPLVGCVISGQHGEVLAEGWHERPGGPHAEAVALAAAGERAAGATVYVTLEPCAHRGRTGPCVDALLAAGVGRVVAAMPDPNPVASGGAERLRQAGVDVTVGVLAEEARHQNRVFLHDVTHRRPFVVVKAAVSLDGRIAAADGSSQWLTGAATRARAHRLRAEVDAVAVGSGTVLADDPLLTVRDAPVHASQPLRVVVDRRGRVRADRRVFDHSAPTLHVVGSGVEVPRRPGVDVAVADDLPQLLDVLYRRDVRGVLIEGGGELIGAFVRHGLVDELVVHVAPLLLGGGGRPLLDGDGIATLSVAPRFRLRDVERIGDDTVLTLAPEVVDVGLSGAAMSRNRAAGVGS